MSDAAPQDPRERAVLYGVRRLYLAFRAALPGALRDGLDAWQDRVERGIEPEVRRLVDAPVPGGSS